jgi:hypothetical protein
MCKLNKWNVTSPSIKSAFSPFWPNNFLPKNGRSLSVVASTDRSPFRVAGRFASYQSARFQLWRFSKETTQPNKFCARSLISGWAAVAARGGRRGRDGVQLKINFVRSLLLSDNCFLKNVVVVMCDAFKIGVQIFQKSLIYVQNPANSKSFK